MGRYRTSCGNNEPKDFNTYYNKKKGMTIYKNLRTTKSCYNNLVNNNILMNNSCINKNIVYYKSYDSLINLSKISGFLRPECSDCADVPVLLANGINSEICYDELYEDDCSNTESNDLSCCCGKCIKIPIMNNCKEKTGKIFPYGHFNNKVKNPLIKIHSLKNIEEDCESKLNCASYEYCKCPPGITDCKCCEYSIITPLTNTENIKYYENSNKECDTNSINNNEFPSFISNDLGYFEQLKKENNEEDKILSSKAINVYSKYSI